jgi:hypothetical protein
MTKKIINTNIKPNIKPTDIQLAVINLNMEFVLSNIGPFDSSTVNNEYIVVNTQTKNIKNIVIIITSKNCILYLLQDKKSIR